MLKSILSLFLLLSFSAFAESNHEKLNKIKELRRIAIGSCNYHYVEQPLWQDMAQQKPDLFIWGGDAVYGDWNKTIEDLAESFATQNKVLGYVEFKKKTPIIGVWDDHDYAYDNAEGDLPYKKESQQLFLDFVEEPANSLRRKQEGIYASYEFGEGERKVKIILLDNRYFKNLEPKAPILGEVQWQWLEQEFKESTASFHFIVTGLSIHSPLLRYTEEWGEYPVELNRLHALIEKYNPKGRVFLTGDKHFSAIFQRWGEVEFMASGLTNVVDRRVWWYLGRQYARTYFGQNYGQIDIDWEDGNPHLTLSIRTPTRGDIHVSKFRWQKDHWHWYY